MGAVEERLDLPYPLRVDDRGLVNSHEARRIEARLDVAQRLAQQVGLLARVDPKVVALALDPVNLVRLQEREAPSRPQDDAVEPPRPRLQVREHREDPPLKGLRRRGPDPLTGPRERLAQAFPVEGLQQVV